MMALSMELNMHIEQVDVTTAYLNREIDTVIYMDKPNLLEEMLK